MLWGDLNAHLDVPLTGRDEAVADVVDGFDLVDATRHFRVRRRGRVKGRWTFSREHRGRTISSQVDYLFCREADRCRLRRAAPRTPRRHDSDHRAVVAVFRGGSRARLARYRRRRRRFPISLPRIGPQGELETAFEELKATVQPPPARARNHNSWISSRTWALIDHRAALRKGGRLSGKRRELLTRKIHKLLKLDRMR